MHISMRLIQSCMQSGFKRNNFGQAQAGPLGRSSRYCERGLEVLDQIESKLLNEELQLLKEEHELQKLKYNCSLMSFDIRRMLNEGAHFRPLESKKATCIWKVQRISSS